MKAQNETCATCPCVNGKGYLYAVSTTVLCPCHLPLFGRCLKKCGYSCGKWSPRLIMFGIDLWRSECITLWSCQHLFFCVPQFRRNGLL